MSKTNFADEADKLLNGTASKTTKKKKTNKSKAIKTFLINEVWESRPIHWLAVALSYVAIAYTAYALAKFYVRIPEFVGIVAFAVTLVVGSRAFRRT
jgi:hypothetical protein